MLGDFLFDQNTKIFRISNVYYGHSTKYKAIGQTIFLQQRYFQQLNMRQLFVTFFINPKDRET